MRIRRRTLLQGLGAAALTPAFCACDPPSTPASTLALAKKRIKTVVVLMMENRSFDHAFGSLSLIEGRDDVDGLSAGMHNTLADGTVIAIAPNDANCVADPGHGWNASHNQFDGGSCSGFAQEHANRYGAAEAHRALAYLPRSMQPASYQLADNYALCQRWFASVMGPTWPNRYHAHWATSNGNRGNSIVDAPLPTVFSRLDDAAVPWANYYGNLPFSALYPEHSITSEEYQRLDAFFDDAAAGSLAPFVWLDPIYGRNDDHPPAHPLSGQLLIASVYEAMRQSPQWDESLLVVTYDEHGGFFDHVPPPLGADPFASEGFDQRGFRVPGLVVGPYVKRAVSSTVFDHTSLIATVLRLHDLPSLNVRDAAANDLLSLLDVERMAARAPDAGVQLDPLVVRDDTLGSAQCIGTPLHIAPEGALVDGVSITGQPEFEAAFVARYGNHHPKDLRLQGAASMQLLMERARALGVTVDSDAS